MIQRAICLALFVFLSSSAQAVTSINTQTFNPSVSDRFVLLEDAMRTEWPRPGKYYLGANYNYVHDPLVATTAPVSPEQLSVISSIQTFDFFVGYKPDPQFGLYFGVPIHAVTYATGNILGAAGTNTVLGDMKILGKIRLNKEDSYFGIALIPELRLPTGNSENLVSDASTYVGIRAAIERDFESFIFNGTLGYGTAANAMYTYQDFQGNTQVIDYRKRMNFGLGGFVRFTDEWGASLEYNSEIPIPFSTEFYPSEVYGGLRYAHDGLAYTGGMSFGKIGGGTGMDFRIVLGIRYAFADDSAVPAARPAPVPAMTPAPAIAPAPALPPVAQQQPIAPAAPVATPAQNPWANRKAAPPPGLGGSSLKGVAVLKGRTIELSIPVNFESGTEFLTLEAKGILGEVANIIKTNSTRYKKILIDGHTDNVGKSDYNRKLSLRRAKSVKTFLVSTGIPSKKLVARGFGFSKPKVAYSNPNAREVNRRVEFTLSN